MWAHKRWQHAVDEDTHRQHAIHYMIRVLLYEKDKQFFLPLIKLINFVI